MIQIDADDGAVRVEFPHGEAVTFEGLPPGSVVERGTQRALFLESEEADVLKNMIAFLVKEIRAGRQRARPGSEEVLSGIAERLAAVFET